MESHEWAIARVRDLLAPPALQAHHADMDEAYDLSGKLLIAMPDMGDTRFAGVVIYICSHTDDGAMGLILNRPKPDIAFAKLLEQMKIDSGPSCRDVPVHFGGPVERARGFVLHTLDFNAAGNTTSVTDSIGLTATQDVLKALAHGNGPARAMLALGYTGWGPGQLEGELAENGWLTGPANKDLLFGGDHAGKWAAALALIGVAPQALSLSGGRA